jgi:hypothetical protein
MRTSESFLCDIKFDGCGVNAVRAWLCQVEQTEVAACSNCSEAWKDLVRDDPTLLPRCPSCAKARINRPRARVPMAGPITGLVADTVDEAMRIEGVLVNIRQAVLRRLARDAPWLNGWGNSAEESAPPGGQSGESAALPGRDGGPVGAPIAVQTAVP